MFFKKIKNKLLLLLISIIIIPNNVLAYSEYIIAGGENIGIELNSSGVIIVGTYEVNGKNIAKESGLQNGDKIIKINDQNISNIKEMLNIIDNTIEKENISITYLRGSKKNETILKLSKNEDNVYKTGLYVKDSITGVGTLTYIDPNTKLFGALGHEIIEKNTGQKLEIKEGKIYSSTVTGVTKSDIGNPGEKNAKYDNTKIYGSVFENTTHGIFGDYTNILPDKKLYKVGKIEEIKTGEASIFTVINGNEVEEFKINIIKVNKESNLSKNILFEVTDENLLRKTGGIIQGMSGSPIIQDENIIGAVTHVVVDDPAKGYGIFITTMLEEAEN
ncbi:MAG: SpoIVB peptidase [Bacilli bacterium]|nr:SpoIVB peptidase [Bacilli bacterium]